MAQDATCEYRSCGRDNTTVEDGLTLCRPHRMAVARLRAAPSRANRPLGAEILLEQKRLGAHRLMRNKFRPTPKSDIQLDEEAAQATASVLITRAVSTLLPETFGAMQPGFRDIATQSVGRSLAELLVGLFGSRARDLATPVAMGDENAESI